MTETQDTTMSFEDQIRLEDAFDFMEAAAEETAETERRLRALHEATQDREDEILREHSERLRVLVGLDRAGRE